MPRTPHSINNTVPEFDPARYPRRTRLRYFRVARNLTQQQIADALGVGPTAISNAERRRGAIDQEKWYALADLLEVDVRTLQGYGPPPENISILRSELTA